MIELPKTPSMSLNGRKAIITGASSGIGWGVLLLWLRQAHMYVYLPEIAKISIKLWKLFKQKV